MIYVELLAVAAVTVYVVGVSGFTTSWRTALARLLDRHAGPGRHITEETLHSIKPFDCERCMTWWCCLIWALLRHDLTIWTVAAAAAASLLSKPMQQFLLFIREGLTRIFARLNERL